MGIIIYKSSNQRQNFDLEKLTTSIEKSCLAVGDKPEQAKLFAKQVAGQIESWLADKSEVTAADLRRQVELNLAKFNPQASQFYQNFKQLI